MSKLIAALLLAVSVACTLPDAQAMSGETRLVLRTGAWGLAGGTVLGLIAAPMTKSSRSIFIGSSVGLYLGLAAGIYALLDQDNPENPLRAEAGEPQDADLPRSPLAAPKSDPAVRLSVVRF